MAERVLSYKIHWRAGAHNTPEIKTTWHPVEVIDGKGSGY